MKTTIAILCVALAVAVHGWARAEQRAKESRAWADAVQNEVELVLEKARAGR